MGMCVGFIKEGLYFGCRIRYIGHSVPYIRTLGAMAEQPCDNLGVFGQNLGNYAKTIPICYHCFHYRMQSK
jgi:hypothetical protein